MAWKLAIGSRVAVPARHGTEIATVVREPDEQGFYTVQFADGITHKFQRRFMQRA